MIVTDNTIYNLNLTNSLQNELENNNIKTVVFKDVQANPTTNNVEEAFKIYIENKCNALIGFGGGSSIDCATIIYLSNSSQIEDFSILNCKSLRLKQTFIDWYNLCCQIRFKPKIIISKYSVEND